MDLCFDDTGCSWYNQCFWLQTQCIDLGCFKKLHTDIGEFIINSIDQGYYIIIHLDEFYVPEKWLYQKKHFRHVVLICGYNRTDRYYSILGFNHKWMYAISKISFAEFERAFSHLEETEPIILAKKRENGEYAFDLKLVEEQLSDYVYAKNASERYRLYQNPNTNYAYGLDVYGYLKMYFEVLAKEKIWCDLRSLHILWEHKKCMRMRTAYMQENKYLSPLSTFYDDYLKLERTTEKLRNMQIKYIVRRDKEVINKIMMSLDQIAVKEYEILTKMLDEISKCGII